VATNNGARPKSGASSKSLGALVERVVAEFSTLSGITPEQVSGLRSTDDGWSVLVEVVDVERIPSTTSILSTYRVDADPQGGLVGYERIRRYTRASTDAR
jgi:Gas vesicle synthesis protein GvpO